MANSAYVSFQVLFTSDASSTSLSFSAKDGPVFISNAIGTTGYVINPHIDAVPIDVTGLGVQGSGVTVTLASISSQGVVTVNFSANPGAGTWNLGGSLVYGS